MPPTREQIERLACILPPVKVLAIDNKKSDLEWIRNGLESAGVPCVTLLYDISDGITRNESMGTSYVRFLFMDLNLEDVDTPTAGRVVGALEEVLSQLKIAGPFALIFWTTHADLVTEVMRLLGQRRTEGVKLPFFSCTMNKTMLELPPPEDPTYGDRLEALKEEISAIFTRTMIFSSVVSWENMVTESAANTLNSFHDLISEPQADGTAQANEKYCRLLKAIGSAAWGFEHAKSNWGASVASGLNPFVADKLDNEISTNGVYRGIWHEALDNPAKATASDSVRYRLNAACVIDESCDRREVLGAWYEFAFGIDYGLYVDLFGKAGTELLNEFINYEDSEADVKIAIENTVKLGILDITRACDHANKKYGTKTFVLGAIVPYSLKERVKWKNPPRDKHSDAVYKFPSLAVKKADGNFEKTIVQLSFRYILSLPDTSGLLRDEKTNIRFRVRKQILSEISAKYGAHTSNPGIMSF